MRSAALADVGVRVLDCDHRTPLAQLSGHPYIAIPDIQDGRVTWGTTRRISDEDLVEWTRRTRPQRGDVIVTRRGRVGDTAALLDDRPCAIGQNLVILRSDGRAVHPGYLRWVTRSPAWHSEVARLLNVGAVFSSLNVSDMSKIRLPFPRLGDQRAIAEVLGALDDKIDANSDLSRTLNDLAAEYFSQSVQAAGEGPTYGNVADVFGGGTPSTKTDDYWGGEIRWATPTDVTALQAPYLEDTSRHLTSAGLAACASELHPAGSILMTSRATIGAFALAGGPTAVNQGFIVVRPKDSQLDMWLFHEMQSRVSDYLAVANGATFLELSRGRFKTMPVRWAPEDVMRQFGAIARPLHERARAAIHESRSLATLRDTLLPELMSGRLTVKDAEHAVEEAL